MGLKAIGRVVGAHKDVGALITDLDGRLVKIGKTPQILTS